MRVLVACEYSGIVRDAFLRHGHDAVSCDLLPTESPGPHYQGDVRDILGDGWDLMIAHPPCTYLSNSGVRWLHEDPSRWQKMLDGANFFKTLLDADIEKIAIENPVLHGYALQIIGRGPDQTVQPWMFGHGECKRICFWLKNLPRLLATKYVEGREQRIWKLPPSEDRGKERSRFYEGIADAMPNQWGHYGFALTSNY